MEANHQVIYKGKGYYGKINATTYYRAGGVAGTWNIYDKGKYVGSTTTDVLAKMIKAKSRFKKKWGVKPKKK